MSANSVAVLGRKCKETNTQITVFWSSKSSSVRHMLRTIHCLEHRQLRLTCCVGWSWMRRKKSVRVKMCPVTLWEQQQWMAMIHSYLAEAQQGGLPVLQGVRGNCYHTIWELSNAIKWKYSEGKTPFWRLLISSLLNFSSFVFQYLFSWATSTVKRNS